MKNHGTPARAHSSIGSLASIIRVEVQARVRDMVPEIIREEIATTFGKRR